MSNRGGRREGSGRPKGSFSCETKRLRAALEAEFPDYHPVVELAKIAMDKKVDVTTRSGCHKEVAKYFCPQLKAVEHKGGEGMGPFTIVLKKYDDI